MYAIMYEITPILGKESRLPSRLELHVVHDKPELHIRKMAEAWECDGVEALTAIASKELPGLSASDVEELQAGILAFVSEIRRNYGCTTHARGFYDAAMFFPGEKMEAGWKLVKEQGFTMQEAT